MWGAGPVPGGTGPVLFLKRTDRKAEATRARRIGRRLAGVVQLQGGKLDLAEQAPAAGAVDQGPMGQQAQKRRVGAVWLAQVLPFYDEACIRSLRGFEEIVYQSLR